MTVNEIERAIEQKVAAAKDRIAALVEGALDTADILSRRLPAELRADFLLEKRAEVEAWRRELFAEIDRVAIEPTAPSLMVH